MAEVSIVLVHGAFHSFRCWSDLTPILEDAGVECRAVDLPNTSMADDVAATRRCLDTVATPVVLLGHSYGGAVVCGAGTHPAVQSLIFLAAAVIDSDECLAASRGGDMISPALAAAMRPTSADGPLYVDTEAAGDVFYNHCPAPVVAAAVSQIRPIRPACMAGAIGAAAWRSRPTMRCRYPRRKYSRPSWTARPRRSGAITRRSSAIPRNWPTCSSLCSSWPRHDPGRPPGEPTGPINQSMLD